MPIPTSAFTNDTVCSNFSRNRVWRKPHSTEAGQLANETDIVGARLGTLIEMGQHGQAISSGRNAEEVAEKTELGYMVNDIKMPLEVAEAGEYEHAR